MRRALAVFALSLSLLPAALLLAPSEAAACSCIRTESAVAHARDVDLVFTAKLIRVADAPKKGPHDLPEKIFSFEVTRTIKGNLDKSINLVTANNSAACGRDYGKPGGEWLIYARQDPEGTIRDNLCSRSAELGSDGAAADITELEANIDTLDQPNPPAEPEPNDTAVDPAEPEVEPIFAPADAGEQEGAADGPQPAEPGKKGCSIGDGDEGGPSGALALGLLLLGLGLRRRR